jgi:peptidoglycan/LPS O-acetylase OafA/YrhL
MSMHGTTPARAKSRGAGANQSHAVRPPPAPVWQPPPAEAARASGRATATQVEPWRPFAPREQPKDDRYRPGLDGLRAIAVAGVLLYHAGVHWIPGGFLGVDLFFVISGYLITSLLIKEVARAGTISFAGFYRRRARRLLPALFLMLLVTTTAVVLFWPQELSKVRGDVVASLGYVANWWFIVKHQSYFQASGRPSPFQHLWSLAVEEQFYLVWPAVVGMVLAGRSTARRLAGLGALAVGGAIASTAWMAAIAIQKNVPYGTDASRIYLGTDTHAMGVLLGAGAAALIAAWEMSGARSPGEGRWTWLCDLAGIVGLAGVCGAMVWVTEFQQSLYRGGFLAFSALAVLPVMATARASSRLGAALGSEPLRWIGKRSYALYLWHWPIFVFTRPQLDLPLSAGPDLVLRLAMTAAAAEVSYRLVEQPIRANGVRFYLGKLKATMTIPRRWKPAVIAYAAGLVLALGLATFLVTGGPGPSAATLLNQAGAQSKDVSHPVSIVAHDPHPTPPAHAAAAAAPAPPAHAGTAPAPPLSLTAVGDSVMLGADADLQAVLPGAAINAVEGRQAPDAFSTLNRLLASGHLGHDVILQIGTNGTIDPGALNGLLAKLAGRKVILLNVHVPRPWQNPDNATIAAAVKTHPGVELLDWNAAASAHPAWFWNDGIHLRPAGAQAYTALILAALK